MKKMMTIIVLAFIAMMSGACSTRLIDRSDAAVQLGSSDRYEEVRIEETAPEGSESYFEEEEDGYENSDDEGLYDEDSNNGITSECVEALTAEDYAVDMWFDAPEGSDDAAWTIMKVIGDQVNDLGCSRYQWETLKEFVEEDSLPDDAFNVSEDGYNVPGDGPYYD